MQENIINMSMFIGLKFINSTLDMFIKSIALTINKYTKSQKPILDLRPNITQSISDMYEYNAIICGNILNKA